MIDQYEYFNQNTTECSEEREYEVDELCRTSHASMDKKMRQKSQNTKSTGFMSTKSSNGITKFDFRNENLLEKSIYIY